MAVLNRSHFRRLLRGSFLALALVPAAISAQEVPVPEALAPYVKDGQFQPGDFGWMRGRASVDDAAGQQRWQQIKDYVEQCSDRATAVMRDQLAAIGAETAHLPRGPYGDAVCGQVMAASALRPASDAELSSWPDRMARARQLWEFARAGARINASITTLHIAEAAYEPGASDKVGWFLLSATFGEQFGRKAMSWGRDERDPPISDDLRPFFEYLASDLVDREDRKNSAWLRQYVEEKGWPKMSVVGKRASSAAWLLVQHADRDPAFQLLALRLMEPLVEEGEVDKGNFAYLYDRIMLKISGKQRYATQFAGCEPELAERPLRPMEDSDPARIDALRAEMGLRPLADYRAQMDKSFGACGTARR